MNAAKQEVDAACRRGRRRRRQHREHARSPRQTGHCVMRRPAIDSLDARLPPGFQRVLAVPAAAASLCRLPPPRSAAAASPPARSIRSDGSRRRPPVIAVEVLVEQHEVAPVRIVSETSSCRRTPGAGRSRRAGRCATAGAISPPRLPRASSSGPSQSGHSTLKSSPR